MNRPDHFSEEKPHLFNRDQLKILIVATPKTGNTWLKLLLSHIYDLPVFELSVDTTQFEQNISALGERWIVHQHYPIPEPDFLDCLARHQIVLLSTVRHPGDVLVSLFHFVRWSWPHLVAEDRLLILKEDEGVMGKHTLAYIQDNTFAEFLSVSLRWLPYTHQIRYEELLAHPIETLSTLTKKICPVSKEKIIRGILSCDLNILRENKIGYDKRHFRSGVAGEWKKTIPNDVLDTLRHQSPYPELLAALGYSFDLQEQATAITGFDYATINPFRQETHFNGNIEITPFLSLIYFSIEGALTRWPEPAKIDHSDCFFNWLNSPVIAENNPTDINTLPIITQLAYFIYQSRPDLQRTFPDIFAEHRELFCRWFVQHAPSEYKIDNYFFLVVSQSLDRAVEARASNTVHSDEISRRLGEKIKGWLKRR
ncbi:sulfotransferase domain-containing protein [Thioflexithrix psekupsensis]|uniref:Sulfotransferase domain-containing protein n=1 Tax=Thioflexithrix psekupsensis TaxID=1570016 RepID=A0A251X4T0_9GAMM|nr:sulfotransferase domain-containing protein [Thioflexithrix psekupsensis]OUD12152.1 hypothetical protein TPSD3_13575 [Thioflexithrix psekupsensis]